MKFADEIIKEKENSTRDKKNYINGEEFERWLRDFSNRRRKE